MSEIDLYCLPYAGGSAHAIYSKWVKKIDPRIKLRPLELAGHGRRISEPFYENVQIAVQDFMRMISSNVRERPYAFYGHSMGTTLVYELAIAIKAAELPQPKMLFLSGRIPPHLRYEGKPMHKLSDADFIESIRKIGGTPSELFDNNDLLKIFLPILRNDYSMIEQYRMTGDPQLLDADIVFFHSDEDRHVNIPDILEWAQYSKRSFEYQEFHGGHFFINEVWDEICISINQKLLAD